MADVLVMGGEVVDGTGAAPSRPTCGCAAGVIVEMGPDLAADGEQVIDAAGAFVTPGSSTPTPTSTGRCGGTPTSIRCRRTATHR